MQTTTVVNREAQGKANGWLGVEILSSAQRFLAVGGSQARREIVKTTLALQRLLQEA